MTIREHFPLLDTCVYLNNNSTGAVPRGAERVLSDYWKTLSTWRDSVWDGWHDGLQKYMDGLESFIGAPPGTVAVDVNLSTFLARIASCFDYRTPRNRVVTTDLDFPTVPFIWKAFQRYGAELDVVGTGGPRLDEEELLRRVDERTLIVSVPHAGYSSGATLDLRRLVEHAHSVGAMVVVDAFQSVGILPLDVTELGVDFVLGGAHKWMCGAGTAFLYVRADLLPGLEPAATGWQAGVRARAAGLTVVSPVEPDRRGGVVCLDVPDGQAVKSRLAERDMICSWRDYLRIGPHIYNTLDEIDEFMDALVEVTR